MSFKCKYSARKSATRKSPPNNSPKDAGLLPSCGYQNRHAAACGYRIPITPSSRMAEPDGPSVSLNGVVVALLWCDRTRSASASFNNVVVTILRCGRMDASLVALQ